MPSQLDERSEWNHFLERQIPHIFYQYNPNGAFHGTIHWGHASSADLVHWTDHPIALPPGPEGADRDQCYSGAAFINKEGVPTFIYHGLPDGICLATSDDDMLINWEKHPANPIIPNPQAGDEFRIGGAPCAWVEGDTYYALTGNSGAAPPDVAYLYTSQDFAHWEYLHPFYEGGVFTEWGEDCGCPDFFRLGDKHVLSFTSHPRGRNSISELTPINGSPRNVTNDWHSATQVVPVSTMRA